MSHPSPASRILLVAGPRTAAGLGQPSVRRYRLARVLPSARPGETAALPPLPKRPWAAES